MARGWDRPAAEAAAAAEREREAKLAAVLAPWIKEQGISAGGTAWKVAASVAGSSLMRPFLLALEKTGVGAQPLRDAVIALAAAAAVDPAELATDNYVDGHGRRPGYLGARRWEVVND